MITRLILIRHGVTEWNLKKIYCGSSDIGLSKIGRAQVRKLKARIRGTSVHKVYSSDKKRAVQSAEAIFKKAKIEKIADLRELHFGVLEGLTYQQILKAYSLLYRRWLDNPYKTKIPEGENLKDFQKRVIRAFKKIIVANKGKTVALVCHGGVISVFLNHILKSRRFWKLIPPPASLSIVEYKNRRPKIILLNDVSHLT
jgi:broad specificity phosphatase PhoE